MDKHEKEIQKALGIDAHICTYCKDEGEIRQYFQYSTSRDTHPCEYCKKGWDIIWQYWLKTLKRGHYSLNHVKTRACGTHPLYIGESRPTVLCDQCWAVWLGAPKNPGELLNNV